MIQKIETKQFKLKELSPSQYNPRRIRDENREGLRASMGRFGCVEDIVVNIRGGRKVIVGGHQRYDILLKENGQESVWPCKVVDLSEADEKALNLALNNPHLQGEFTEQLPEHIRQLRDELADEMAAVDLRIDQLRQEIAAVDAAVGPDFFEDNALAKLTGESDYGSMTFVFTNDQLETVKRAISVRGKPWIADRIVDLCEKEVA
jgi:hypothetical protein